MLTFFIAANAAGLGGGGLSPVGSEMGGEGGFSLVFCWGAGGEEEDTTGAAGDLEAGAAGAAAAAGVSGTDREGVGAAGAVVGCGCCPPFPSMDLTAWRAGAVKGLDWFATAIRQTHTEKYPTNKYSNRTNLLEMSISPS